MAVDDLTTEYHLTPKGWIAGTRKFFRKIEGKEVPRPADAVETWETRIYQRSQWSSEERSSEMLWHDPKVPDRDRDALRRKFEPPFADD